MAKDREPASDLALLAAEQGPLSLSDKALTTGGLSGHGRATGPAVHTGLDPLFFSVAAAAETLAVSDDTVYELLDRGELPCLRIGRRRVIPRRAVELIIEHVLADFDPEHVAARLTGPRK